ncbi:MAG: ATP-grasp domain-containing protein [Muribaculaceae bacterium]|nr:ATP-grasp domain-containing protein [Muribaculaceae bacterium]
MTAGSRAEKARRRGAVNILFLGGAKRVVMARMLQDACAALGLGCTITGYELSPHCPLGGFHPVETGLRWSDPEIFAHLDSVCRRHDIDIVLPFVDRAVEVAAAFVSEHSSTGVCAPVSDYDVCRRMFDKCAAAELFGAAGVAIPRTWKPGDSCEGLIAKPRLGSASKGLVMIDSLADLLALGPDPTDAYLIQQRIDDRDEISVDCYVRMSDREPLAISPRYRLEVNGGEVVRTTTCDDIECRNLTLQAIEVAGLRGAVTVQLIRDRRSGRLMVMEVNPRLGGGCPASVHAGADIPRLIIADFLGEATRSMNATPGVTTVRYLEDVVFYPENFA